MSGMLETNLVGRNTPKLATADHNNWSAKDGVPAADKMSSTGTHGSGETRRFTTQPVRPAAEVMTPNESWSYGSLGKSLS